MAVDPSTGQSVVNAPRFDQQYAGFLDPTSFGQISSEQNQLGTQSALAQQMMQAGYIPRSGFGGALAQMVQAAIGAHMLKSAQEQQAQLYQQQIQAMNQAAQAKHAQEQADLDAAEKRAIAQATGIDEGKVLNQLKYAKETAAADAAAAATKAQALLPTEAQKIQLETQGKIQAAMAAAEVANRRGYVVQDAAGNQHIITPQGKEIYETSTPGGGKLTEPQKAQNEVDVATQKELLIRNAAATQVPHNAANWVATYLGIPADQMQQQIGNLPPHDQMLKLADMVRNAPITTMVGNINPATNQALIKIGSDLGVNMAGTKRATPGEDVIKTEIGNSVTPYQGREANARILESYADNIKTLQEQIAKSKTGIESRQPPGVGSIPAAQPGPQNTATPQAPTQAAVTHVWTPDGGIQPVQ